MTTPVLKVPCARCAVGIPVDAEMLKNANLLGQALVVEHAEGECPEGIEQVQRREGAPQRIFRVQVLMWEIPAEHADADLIADLMEHAELMAGTGLTVRAANFPEAVNGPMTNWLNETWPRMQREAPFADLPVEQARNEPLELPAAPQNVSETQQVAG